MFWILPKWDIGEYMTYISTKNQMTMGEMLSDKEK